ncbi:right-handed parallel beta-helix repeat-containing protein [Singulisphaera acidiphila]|uniref:Uncharacterized protein n=1 Tax=Singulisphaera acidiphila (strain ATCC BAA-1392 / DSM 18658 / VKM B-2454 / MOB10) TaxID=886293 RepID=L0DBZ0_SINAD|nr:hypothetical protein [Singulisphaera acidiphila]AGA26191.1 hypothetical protein Sinac_1826 [Singulisphaera acidiphila DSM 18658]
MVAASWTIALSLALVNAGGPTGRWLGQDGHDLVSPSTTLEPNGYQDIHIQLVGLPAQRAIKTVEIRPDGGFWSSDRSSNSWRIAAERSPGSTTADLYFENEHPEKGRTFQIKIDYKDGMVANLSVRGGRSNPNLRMPGTMPTVRWAGQDGQDFTAAELGVGPDGYQDARLTLEKLDPKATIKGVVLDAGEGVRWHVGINPEGDYNAEIVRDAKDPSIAQLYFQPDRDLAGRNLSVTISYPNGKSDALRIKGERTDPKLAMPLPSIPKLEAAAFQGRWLGQDGSLDSNRRDVHVALSGLPAGRAIEAAVLSDSVFRNWTFRSSPQVKLDVEPEERPLTLRRGDDSTKADLYFTPYRNEVGATLTLRLIFANGESTFAQFGAGECDPFAGLPQPAPTTVVAKPGDDLHDLVDRFGTVTLAGGTHRLSKPLVLNKPVTLAGEPGAILEFSQGTSEAPWTTAVKIHCGSTTLRDFAIRFAGPVRWNQNVNYGPAVIGSTDNLEPARSDRKIGLTFERLDLAGPPPSGATQWEDAVRLMRLNTAQAGSIKGCTLFGGVIEFFAGPWQFVDNNYRGTPSGTFSHGVVVGHYVHDLLVRGNRIKPVGRSGKTWRFLVVTGYGRDVQVENNTVEGVGPRDDDTIPSQNAPEIILTESYRLNFEGRPSAVSSDGRLLTINPVFGGPPEIGSLVSVLTGTRAGEWRSIAQVISPTTFLLSSALPSDASVISISSGFVNMRVEGNTVDARGGRGACCLVLPGNHFGTLIRGNRFIGGGEIVRLAAAASESPMIWGWSHAPFLGGQFEKNILEDAVEGGLIGVEHSQYTKANMGRTYMTISLKNNVIRWSDTFLRQRARAKEKAPLRGLTFGFLPSHDSGELVVTQQGDHLEAPASALGNVGVHVNAAQVNGLRITKKGFRLPAAVDSNEVLRATKRP